MTTFNKVIPGKVVNEGIVSKENLTNPIPVFASPAHFPDFAMVTPRGPTKRDTVAVADFKEKFGDVMDPYGPFYNPIAVAIQKLGSAAQASFSFKRLTNNVEVARVILGVVLFEGVPVPNYERDSRDDYVLDIAGNPKVVTDTPTVPGIFVSPATMYVDQATAVGEVKSFEVTAPAGKSVPAETKGTFYPLFELLSGIGDSYNAMYAAIGHSFGTDWNEIARFVINYGAYPFTMNIGELLSSGIRVPATTTIGSPDSMITLFNSVGGNNVRYSVQGGLDRFTGRQVNRPVEDKAAPFESAHVYTNYLNDVCTKLYAAEYGDGKQTPPVIKTDVLPKGAIMNPLSLVNHYGKNYHHIVFGGLVDVPTKLKGTRVGLNNYLQANGGINPYADKTGKYPDAPADWATEVDGTWVANTSSPAIVSHKQYWYMNQSLLEAYFVSYRRSLDVKDVIRNRTSFMWDVGYNEAVKEALIDFLGVRKDIIVVLCATEYLKKKSQEQLYSTMESLNSKIVMYPESETFQSHACRAAINMWDCRIIDEPTFGRFSLNIDTMYAFAYAGGGNDGKIYGDRMPDHEGNRTLRVAHDPLVQFEDDDPAANNLTKGAISVTPLNTSQYCRPALPTVYDNTDSVLKDLSNVWKCVCVEKVLQDTWIKISGDTQYRQQGYIAFVKDTAEKDIREKFGSVIVNWEVDPGFREDEPNGKSVMYTTTRLWFSKGVYMMNSVLEAYNETSLTAQ